MEDEFRVMRSIQAVFLLAIFFLARLSWIDSHFANKIKKTNSSLFFILYL